jgi:hypothetical protein
MLYILIALVLTQAILAGVKALDARINGPYNSQWHKDRVLFEDEGVAS